MFLGTSVVSGTATALVVATGPEDGVRRHRRAAARRRAPETEFERGLRRFGLLILRTTVVLVLFILLVSIALKHDAFESLLFAVALAVGLTPEFLPMITSVTLTQGALRMARDQVIVKHLPAIQNFGSIDILCSDKTGTLTSGEMRFDRRRRSGRRGVAAAADARLPQQPLRDRHPQPAGRRDPRARRGRTSPAIAKVDEIPFDFERRRLSVVVEAPTAAAAAAHHQGGPGGDPRRCRTAFEVDGQVAPLDAATRAGVRATVHER